jgi:hypothetical protein
MHGHFWSLSIEPSAKTSDKNQVKLDENYNSAHICASVCFRNSRVLKPKKNARSFEIVGIRFHPYAIANYQANLIFAQLPRGMSQL